LCDFSGWPPAREEEGAGTEISSCSKRQKSTKLQTARRSLHALFGDLGIWKTVDFVLILFIPKDVDLFLTLNKIHCLLLGRRFLRGNAQSDAILD
jgi:hypothetical protein